MKYLLIICTGILYLQSNVQEVKSKSYELMLQALLSHSVPEVSVKDIEADKQVYWLDARAKKEYEISRISNSIWIGHDDFTLERIESIPKTAEIIVYCSVGYRSEKIAEKLVSAGYENVSNLFGGIFEWKNQGRKVYDEENSVTNKVHGYSKIWSIWLDKGEVVY